jgi:drug/metabolite transporter (DMT)-like permease
MMGMLRGVIFNVYFLVAIFAFVFLDERPSVREQVEILMAAGVIVLDFKKRKKRVAAACCPSKRRANP